MTNEEREKAFKGEFNILRKKGYNNADIHEAIIMNANFKIPIYERDYNVSKRFEAIMKENDRFHNIDASFMNVLLDIANGAGANLVDLQREINAAAELANKHGASPLGEEAANFVKDNLVDIGILAVSFFAPGIAVPKAISMLYGGAKTISHLRRRYAELKDKRLDKKTIVLMLTLEYGKGKFFGGVAGGISEKVGKATGGLAKKAGLKDNDIAKTVATTESGMNVGMNYVMNYAKNVKSK